MKNYYAILEVPVGCGVADIRQAYRRLSQENLDNAAAFAELKEAHEVLTTPARRADYDRAAWGETFLAGGGAAGGGPTLLPGGGSLPGGETLLPGAATLMPGGGLPAVLDASGGGGHCPMGPAAQCPVLLGRAAPTDPYCPECGFLLAGLSAAADFEAPIEDGGGVRLEEPSGRSHRLRVGPNIVGREGADVLLPDKTVSRQHARLEVGEDGTVTAEDLGSTNGTQVGGDVLVPHIPRTVKAGDRVRFGSVVTELRLPSDPESEPPTGAGLSGDGADPAPAPAQPEAPHSPARAQVVETREEGGRTLPLFPGTTTFGRRADSSVIIQGDPYVSGSHAQIVAEGDVFVLTDIGSTNGTLLNGQRLAVGEPQTLRADDLILIGGTAMRFEMLDVAEDVAEEMPVEGAPADDAPAEPRERTAPEYDVPDDVADDGIPTRASHPQATSPEDSSMPDTATQVER